MYKYILASLLLATVALAEDTNVNPAPDYEMRLKPTPCKNTDILAKEILEKYGEEPVWRGEDDVGDSKYVITYNKKTKTWTFVQYNDNVGCVLGNGTNQPKSKT